MKAKGRTKTLLALGDLSYKLLLLATVLSIGGVFLYWFYYLVQMKCEIVLGDPLCFRNDTCTPCAKVSGTARYLGSEWAVTLLPIYLASVIVRTAYSVVGWARQKTKKTAQWPSSDSH